MDELQLQPQHERMIREHGRRAFPVECCGFLLGRDAGGARQVAIVEAAANDREQTAQHNRFTIGPEAFIHAERMARQQKLDVLGFYHSHPNAPARPSEYDLEHGWPVYSYVIVSVNADSTGQMTSWVLRNDRSAFDQQTISIV